MSDDVFLTQRATKARGIRSARGANGDHGRAAERGGESGEGVPLAPDLDQALLHGSSIGGARPKAAMVDGDKKMIAKFSSSTDTYNVVKAEYRRREALCH